MQTHKSDKDQASLVWAVLFLGGDWLGWIELLTDVTVSPMGSDMLVCAVACARLKSSPIGAKPRSLYSVSLLLTPLQRTAEKWYVREIFLESGSGQAACFLIRSARNISLRLLGRNILKAEEAE